MSVVAQDEEGAEVRAAYERAADGTASSDERGEPVRRMFAAADSDAVSICTLHGVDDIDRFPPGLVPLDTGLVCARTLPARLSAHPSRHVHRLDHFSAVAHTGASGSSAAAQDDGDRYAALHALHFVERACGLVALLAGGKHRRLLAATDHQSPDQGRKTAT